METNMRKINSAIVVFLALWALIAQPAAAQYEPVSPEDSVVYMDDYLAEPEPVYDPLEGLNRGIFAFNKVVDQGVLRPVSIVYKSVFPSYARDRVSHFLDNLKSPIVFANSLLQGDAQNTFVTFWRFAINSTLGVLGMFDIATELGVPQRNEEDFGQTLAVWGLGEGPYLVLPLLGPSGVRDVLGRGVDVALDPLTYNMLEDREHIYLRVADVIDARTRLGAVIDNTYRDAIDPYATFRSLYLQRREALIKNASTENEVK